MIESMKKLFHILGSLSRTLLGLTFIFSGFVKAIDPLGTTYKIEDYLHAFGGFFTSLDVLAFPASVCLIGFEFILGVCLLLNVRTNWTSWLALVMMLVMTPLTLYIALNNPVSDCGCFGDALVLTNWQTFYKNIVLLALVILLLVTKRSIPSTFRWKGETLIASLAITIVSSLMVYCMFHLPIIDFRPYKIGNNIPALMEYPEDAEPDVYEVRFIYEKDGVQREFTMDNYPKGDKSWTFVDQNTTLIKKGYEPPIHDFEIITEDFDDITEDVLYSDSPVTLVVMYDLNKANKKQAQRLSDLYEQVLSRGEEFYVLTGSGTETREVFREEMNATYPICTTDPVTLKTIVRANPGVFVVQKGTIIDKYNMRNR